MHDIPNEEGLNDDSAQELSADEEKLLDELGLFGESRRQFLGQGVSGALGIFALQLLAKEKALAALTAQPDAAIAQNAGLEMQELKIYPTLRALIHFQSGELNRQTIAI
jgi:hypothetical protein